MQNPFGSPRRQNISSKPRAKHQPLVERLETRDTPAVLTGSAYVDTNNNLIRDASEIGVPGLAITLAGNGSSIQATTDANGNYNFTNLKAGIYTLVRGGVNPIFPVGGNAIVSSVGGDLQSANDKITNVRIEDGQVATGFNFTFRGLTASGISIRQLLASAPVATVPIGTAGTGNASADRTTDVSTTSTVVFPKFENAGLFGTVYADTNGNGKKDAGETGLANIQVVVTGIDDRGQNVFQQTVTGATGSYGFSTLRPGKYQLQTPETAAGKRFGVPTVGFLRGHVVSNNRIGEINLPSGKKGFGYNFGQVDAPAATTGAGPQVAAFLRFDTGTFGDNITSDPTIQGSVTASPSLTSLKAHFDATAASSAKDITKAISGNGQFILNRVQLNAIKGAALADGIHTLHLIATDAQGRVTTKDVVFTLDRNGPGTITLKLSAADDAGSNAAFSADNRTERSIVKLEGTTTANSKVELYNTAGLRLATATASASGKFSFFNIPLAVGGNDFTVKAFDTAGTFRLFKATFVRNQAPTAKALANVTVAKNAAARVIDLHSFFSDKDTSNTVVRMATTQGTIDLELFDTATPKSVANFLNYVTSTRYNQSIFHRSVKDFVIQGGGFRFNPNVTAGTDKIQSIVTDPNVPNEFSSTRSNLYGTLAMAKQGGDPNSASSQWFVNLNNNSGNLDNQNGGFTVFGKVANGEGLQTFNKFAHFDITNHSTGPGANGALNELPLKDFGTTKVFQTDLTKDNLALVEAASVLRQTERLTFSATSSNTGLLTVSVDRVGQLSLNFVANQSGSATVTVTGRDLSGVAVVKTFTVTVTA